MRKLGFENIGQVVICTLVIGGMIGFVIYGLMVNVIQKIQLGGGIGSLGVLGVVTRISQGRGFKT